MKLDVEQVVALVRLGLNAREIEVIVRAARAHRRFAERYCNGDIYQEDTGQWFDRNDRPIRDLSTRARRRIAKILVAFGGADEPTAIHAYYDWDPRGCCTWLFRPRDVAEGQRVSEAIHSVGVPVCA